MNSTNLNEKKVMIVDDEPNIIIALEFLLQRAGFTVTKADSGIKALELLETEQPDLLILDVMMPGLTGFEVAARLRNQSRFEHLNIVFLTAKGTERDKAAGYATGADYYIVKPFDNDLLVSTVKEILTYG
jgi:DNA-binding response OmpR family regulator